MKRAIAWTLLVGGCALGMASAGPWAWGLGCVVAVVLAVSGAMLLTTARPYDHAKDGI